MSAILALILPMLSSLPGKIGDYFAGQQQIEKLKQQAQMELQRANIELASEMAKAQLEFQKEALKSTGTYFKYFTFIMWFAPYMLQLVCPAIGHVIFENLAGMPEWYAQSCMTIMFTVWGISVSAPVVSNIFSNLSGFLADRRQYKLEKAKIDRKAFFDGIRKLYPQGLSQSQVDVLNKAIDDGEK